MHFVSRRIMPLVAFAFALAFGFFARAAAANEVALTFDDLPTLSLSPSLAYAQTTTRTLLHGLRRYGLPATGFVNENKLEGEARAKRIALLTDWLDAGMDLGNHGYSHLSLNRTPVNAYVADVARGETVIRALLAARGRPLRWFRYPFLETGLTTEVRHTFEGWLAGHGYRVAAVTMENSDWLFAFPYDEAVLRNEPVAAARIKKAYLDYTALVVPWYRGAGDAMLGRPLAYVFLLHASRLNADSIDDLAAILRANHLRPVSLGRAMRDPAYGIADTYVGPDGDEWLSRWSATVQRELPWDSFPEPPADIAAADSRLETPR
jgi:peptidoglycan/xylan/chitin deacetylase (PgdA/CDA1 family)